ncbi:12120_t:CDS:2, partial [Gigaspora rosea]
MSKKFELESNENIGSWKELYKGVLAHFNTKFEPETSPLQIELQTDVQIFENDLVVDLNELFKKPKNEINAQVIRIYADVVQLSDNLEIQMLGSHGIILIVARLFEVKQGCQISIKYKEENHFQLLIYTMEMPSELIIKNEEDKDPLKFKINSPNIGGLIFLNSGEFKDISSFSSKILQKKPFFKILRFTLQIAVALFYNNPDVTRSILTWIIKINELKDKEEKEFEMTKKLYFHALRMLEHLDTFIERKNSGFTFVPRLNMEDYKNHIYQLMGFAKGYENEYKSVLKQDNINKQKVDFLKNKLLDHNDKTKMHELLKEKESKRFELAHNLTKETENKLEDKKFYTASALEELKEGIDDWLKDRKLAAQKELFFAILDLSLSVGKVVIQPGSAHSVIDAIEKVSKSVQDVLENVNLENIRKLVNTTDNEDVKKELGLAKDINDKANKIKEITNDLKSSHAKAIELYKSVEGMSKDTESFNIKNISERLTNEDQKGIMLHYKWESTKNSIDKLRELIKPFEPNIKGAEKYINSLADFINFVDAHIKAKIEAIERSEELSRIQLQAEMYKRIEKRLEQKIQIFESENKSQNEEIKLLLFEHLIDIKYCMTLFMEKYRSAYKYWTLSESNLELSVIEEFNETVIDEMLKDLENGLNKTPQLKMITIEFDEKKYIDEFKQNRFVTIDIPFEHKELNDYIRLRLHTFRVYLKGVGSKNELIRLYISHSGIFDDRGNQDKTKPIHFKSDPEEKRFEYKVLKDYSAESKISDLYEIGVDNQYYDLKYKNYYFAPTPFSQWKISLYPNSQHDLS